MVVRDGERGLSPAVLDGIRQVNYPVVVVMDADLSHPPEKIPDMILALASGQEFVIGSRYVPGGGTDDEWGFFRWLNSRVATLLARPLTDAHDPMAGFFAFRRSEIDKARYLNPIGYKIGLELIVKCGLENVGEVPIQFIDRRFGQSKLSFKEQLRYLQHLRRLYIYKFAYMSSAVQFAAIGISGVFVNLIILTILVRLGVLPPIAVAVGIGVSVDHEFPAQPSLCFWLCKVRATGEAVRHFRAGLGGGSSSQLWRDPVRLGELAPIADPARSRLWHRGRNGSQLPGQPVHRFSPTHGT